MQLTDLVDEFVRWLSARGLSRHTRRCYPNMVRHFLRWLETQTGSACLDLFTEERALIYLAEEEKRNTRPRTRYNKVCSLRSFGAWLVEKKLIPDNPMCALPFPKLDAPHRELISKEEAAALLSATERFPDPTRGLMARAVLLLFLTTGIRRSELLGLKVRDFDLDGMKFVVRHGKGGKSRPLPLHPATCACICEWLRERCPDASMETLFLRSRVAPLCDRSLRTLLREVQAIAGFRGRTNQNPHSQRYFFTDQLVDQRVDIKTIQELLGHSNPQTTWLYIRTNEERKREAVNLIQIPGLSQPNKMVPSVDTTRSDPVQKQGPSDADRSFLPDARKQDAESRTVPARQASKRQRRISLRET